MVDDGGQLRAVQVGGGGSRFGAGSASRGRHDIRPAPPPPADRGVPAAAVPLAARRHRRQQTPAPPAAAAAAAVWRPRATSASRITAAR